MEELPISVCLYFLFCSLRFLRSSVLEGFHFNLRKCRPKLEVPGNRRILGMAVVRRFRCNSAAIPAIPRDYPMSSLKFSRYSRTATIN
jgi:hypothetical protein